MNRIIGMGGVFLLGLATAGCGGIGSDDRAERLEKSIRAYNNLIRWGEYERAAVFLPATAQRAALSDVAGLKHIRVTAFEVKRTVIVEKDKRAEALVEFEYFNEFAGRQRRYAERQSWVYNEQDDTWRRDGGLPTFDVSLGR